MNESGREREKVRVVIEVWLRLGKPFGMAVVDDRGFLARLERVRPR